ncbi:MAG: NAD-dependent epimerase/dehydratase family protein [Bacilli bacterium]
MENNTKRFPGKKVLITGGLGFIGSNLARALVREGADVTLVDSLIPEYGGNMFNIHGIEDRVRVNISDVRDSYSLGVHLRNQDIIFKLAGQTSHLDSMNNPFTDLEINGKAQLSILETCRKVNPEAKIIFASTRQIYGKPAYLPVDEQHPVRPVDVNGINKVAGEWYHLLYNEVYGISACALRLTNTYGPRMRIKDARQTFLGIWIRSVVEGTEFEVWDGEQFRDLNYIDDVVEAFLLAALNPVADGKVFNVGAEPPVRLIDLAEVLIQANGSGSYRIKSFPKERKRIDIGNYYANSHLIQSALGWVPKVSLSDGLGETLSYFRSNLMEYL